MVTWVQFVGIYYYDKNNFLIKKPMEQKYTWIWMRQTHNLQFHPNKLPHCNEVQAVAVKS